jgi:Ser/Thr protein kinase RdoA (MazF antagonist)
MWNEVLNKINKTRAAEQAIIPWGGDQTSIALVSDGINLVYRFTINQTTYYLRLTHSKLREEAKLLAAIDYQQHLFAHGVNVCEPILSENKRWLEHVQQGQETLLAHVCKGVPGEAIHYQHTELALYRKWGETLGRLHSAAKSFKPKQACYSSWDKTFAELEGYAKNESQTIQALLRSLSDYFHTREKTSDNFGIIHGDHREGNVLTDGKQIHIIDFDLPCWDWFMEDLVRPFYNGVIDDDNHWQDKLFPYLDGYFSIMPRESIELSAWAKQIQLKALDIYLWMKNNWSSDVAPGGGDTKQWLARTHKKLISTDWAEPLATWINAYQK